ncbi:MAG: hypothetical protein C4520_08625 [Candidatus Abyssobacteria bacterium SURF_5]|uniref:Uncharacterized protein n=1 Tax=Abyssobacteria bacterium (strain SURF_5) TaxID=2093360 RepID=A0A3A4NSU2_ABYX5|nr:MAG: hypothetical protein C4520_08625 [Candidatus Abyssubacteria bacterium SURF_5]
MLSYTEQTRILQNETDVVSKELYLIWTLFPRISIGFSQTLFRRQETAELSGKIYATFYFNMC